MNTQTGAKQTIDAVIATFSPIMADATDTLPEKIHLLRVGKFPTKKYGELDISAADCQEMVDNFNKGIGLPFDGSTGAPVNFAHQVGLKAAAWIKGLEFDGTNLWGTHVEWSTAGEKAIKGKEFKCFSSEFHPRCLGGKWANPENTNDTARNVFTGGALTNVPMFTGNRPVTASATSEEDNGSEKQVIYISASDEGETHMLTLDTVRGKAAADLNEDEKAFVKAHAAELTTEEQTKFGVQASDTTVTATDKTTVVAASAVKGDEGVVAIEASEVKAMNDRIAGLEASASEYKKDKAVAEVKKHVARGAIKADQLDKWAGLIMASDENKELLENLPSNASLAAEQGKTDNSVEADSAWEEAQTKAQKVVADSNGKIELKDAVMQVLASDEDLNARVEQERNKVNG